MRQCLNAFCRKKKRRTLAKKYLASRKSDFWTFLRATFLRSNRKYLRDLCSLMSFLSHSLRSNCGVPFLLLFFYFFCLSLPRYRYVEAGGPEANTNSFQPVFRVRPVNARKEAKQTHGQCVRPRSITLSSGSPSFALFPYRFSIRLLNRVPAHGREEMGSAICPERVFKQDNGTFLRVRVLNVRCAALRDKSELCSVQSLSSFCTEYVYNADGSCTHSCGALPAQSIQRNYICYFRPKAYNKLLERRLVEVCL